MPRLSFAELDHVGIAVAELESPLSDFLGAPERLTTMRSGVAVGRFGPEARLELVVPERAGSPVERFLANRGPGLHHLALRVDEPLRPLVERLRAEGVEVMGDVEPSSDGRPSVFLHPASTGGVLVELVEGARPE